MNTIKVTTIAATLLAGSYFFANSPVSKSLFSGKEFVPAQVAISDKVATVTGTNNIPDDTLKGKKLELNKELGIINFKKSAAPGIMFRIQILSSKQAIPVDSKIFSGWEVRQYFYDGLYKYTVGGFKSPYGTEPYFYALDDKGFSDAFIVAFKDDNPIPVKQAILDMRD